MRLTPVFTLLTILALGATAFAGDIITKKTGGGIGNSAVKAGMTPTAEQHGSSNITVVDETIENIEYRIEGIPTVQKVKTEDVDEVFLDPNTLPRGLASGQSNLDAGSYDQAIAGFESVLGSGSASDVHKARAAWGIAKAYFAAGDAAAAADALQALKNGFKDSRYVPGATKLRARALLGLGQVEEARKEFESVKAIKGVADADKMEADYYIAWIGHQVAASKNDQAGLKSARTAYDGLKTRLGSSSDPDRRRIRDLCIVGSAACSVMLGESDKAEGPLKKVIKGSDDPQVLAGAYTQLGNVNLRAAGTGNDALRKDALFNFLRVVCLYGSAEGAEDHLAESLYQAGVLFNELKPDRKTDSDGFNEGRRRARREWSECIQRFPGSAWAKRAQSAMQGR